MDIPKLANLHDKETQKMQIMLPYDGRKGNKLMAKMKKRLKKWLQNNCDIPEQKAVYKVSSKVNNRIFPRK